MKYCAQQMALLSANKILVKEMAKQYKRVYAFPQNFIFPTDSPIHGKIVVKVNSFTNPVPVENIQIASLVSEYLLYSQGESVVKELELMLFLGRHWRLFAGHLHESLWESNLAIKLGDFLAVKPIAWNDRENHHYGLSRVLTGVQNNGINPILAQLLGLFPKE
jgi:hypothetical protein